MAAAHPQSFQYDWDGVNAAYCSGDTAMVINVGEYAGAVENPAFSKAAGGRTAYGLCPKGETEWIVNNGPAVHGTNYGIGGVAINRYADPLLQKAAYLFVLWATSHEAQYMVLTEAGGTPTRQSVFDLPEVQQAFQRETAPMISVPPVELEPGVTVDSMPKMPIALTMPFSLKGIQPPNVVLGPKIPTFNEYVEGMSSEIQKCLSGIKTPEKACQDIKKKTDALHGVG
jgi:multiple sugar transport system substrate-binding protein